MKWHRLPWDLNSWIGKGREGFEYHISAYTWTLSEDDPSDFRAFVSKPRKEGVRRQSTKHICVCKTLRDAKDRCEKFERDRLASEARIREAKVRGEEFERNRLAKAESVRP